MNDTTHLTTDELNRLRDAARTRAHTLRHEAFVHLWRGAHALLDRARLQTERSARRLAQRLRRLRGSPAAAHDPSHIGC
jgi:hypothetical protein